jgi:hypothetical protein
MGMHSEVFLWTYDPAALASSTLGSIVRPCRLAPSLSESPVKDDLGIGVILEPFNEMPVEPRLNVSDDEEVADHDHVSSRSSVSVRLTPRGVSLGVPDVEAPYLKLSRR